MWLFYDYQLNIWDASKQIIYFTFKGGGNHQRASITNVDLYSNASIQLSSFFMIDDVHYLERREEIRHMIINRAAIKSTHILATDVLITRLEQLTDSHWCEVMKLSFVLPAVSPGKFKYYWNIIWIKISFFLTH